MIIQILVLCLLLSGVNIIELIWMYNELINLSFQIITQYIKSKYQVSFIHGVCQRTITAVYL